MEEFKDIKGYPDYLISNFGNIKSLKWGKERILKTGFSFYGQVQFSLLKKNKQRSFLIKSLVAKYFIDNPNKLFYVRHKDNDKSNNHYENLEWHKKPLPNQPKGINHYRAKLNDVQVKEIRKKYKSGKYSHRSLGELYGVSSFNIACIIHKITWKNI